MNKILIAIDNLYALTDSIIPQLEYIDKKYEIIILCVPDVGRQSAIEQLEKLEKRNENIKLIQVKRIKNFFDFIRFWLIVKINFSNKRYVVLLGSNVNIEEKVLIHYLNKSSVFFGVLPTVPAVIQYTAEKLTLNNYPLSPNKSSKLLKFKMAMLEQNLLNLISKSLLYRLNNFFSNLSIRLTSFFVNSLSYKADVTALRNGYVNLGLVKAHFTPNDYWSYQIELEYPGEKVITYSDSNFLSSLNETCEKYIFLSDYKVLLLGAYISQPFIHYGISIRNLQQICKISQIFIRPHPRFYQTSVALQSYLDTEFSEIDISLVSSNQSINEQINNNVINVILGYYSSVMNLIQNRRDLLILVDELIMQQEFQVKVTGSEWTGAKFGFNKEIAFIGLHGNLYCHLPEKSIPPAEKKGFLQLLNTELSLLENNEESTSIDQKGFLRLWQRIRGTGQLKRETRKVP